MNSKWISVSSKFLEPIRGRSSLTNQSRPPRSTIQNELPAEGIVFLSFDWSHTLNGNLSYLSIKILEFRIHVESHICPKTNLKARIHFHNWNFVCFLICFFSSLPSSCYSTHWLCTIATHAADQIHITSTVIK